MWWQECLVEDFYLKSRVHALEEGLFLKRDDELSCGVSGSKLRKYASLLYFLKKQGIKRLVLIGGAYSNNIVGLVQVLKERAYEVHAFLKGDTWGAKGNGALLRLLLEDHEVTWVKHEDWGCVEEIAQGFVTREGKGALLVPEGAFMKEALPGAMTLADDIEEGAYDRIFVDAGTGLTAGGLLLGLRAKGDRTPLHIVQMAGFDGEFEERLEICKGFYELLSGMKTPDCTDYTCMRPVTAKSFGAVNATVWKEVRLLARNHGVLAEPVYVAKLLLTVRQFLKEKQGYKGKSLVVHSGGTLGLLGFRPE